MPLDLGGAMLYAADAQGVFAPILLRSVAMR